MMWFTILFILVVGVIVKTFIIVPQESAYVIQRFGKYTGTLKAGFHFLIPFVDVIAYKHNLKEVAYDVPPQECITSDNVSVEIDGILYVKIIDPYKTSYGIDNYLIAVTQLAKTTLRSEIGKLNLDETFAERDDINAHVVSQLDEATDSWGIKVSRYEIKNITPPKQILHEMENQMKAERDKRAEITISEGERQSRINRSEGEKIEAVNLSEGEKQKKINEAEGKGKAIEIVAQATADGIKMIAAAISKKGGADAVDLQIIQSYIDTTGEILSHSKTTVLPLQAAGVMSFFDGVSKMTSHVPTVQGKKGD
jgi:regulator of protease activity HflC (stomatin/prohibitin superfamily)